MPLNVALPICLKAIDFGWVQNAELHRMNQTLQEEYQLKFDNTVF